MPLAAPGDRAPSEPPLGADPDLFERARTGKLAIRVEPLGGADVVLLDNMSPDAMRALVPHLRELAAQRGRALEIEASGGIDERTIEIQMRAPAA